MGLVQTDLQPEIQHFITDNKKSIFERLESPGLNNRNVHMS